MAKHTPAGSPQGDRLKLAYSMTPRTRRAWVKKLMTAQEVVEKAEAELAHVALDAWEAGASYAVIGGALGLHPTSVKDYVENARAERGDGGSEGSG